jgi:hypothetical protein
MHNILIFGGNGLWHSIEQLLSRYRRLTEKKQFSSIQQIRHHKIRHQTLLQQTHLIFPVLLFPENTHFLGYNRVY